MAILPVSLDGQEGIEEAMDTLDHLGEEYIGVDDHSDHDHDE